MWFDDTESTVVQDSCSLHWPCSGLTSKEEVKFSLSWLNSVRSMHGILSSVSTVNGAKRLRSFLFRFLSVSWTNEFPPAQNSTTSSEFHTDCYIRGDESFKVGIKISVHMFIVELSCSCFRKLTHLHLGNDKTLFLNQVDYFTNVLIVVWLYHSEGSLPLIWLLMFCCDITIPNYSKNSGHDGDLGILIEIWKWDSGLYDSLHERSAHFFIVHFDGIIKRVEEQSVMSDDISLLIIPFDLEDVALFLDRLGDDSWIHLEF